ncbi:MAG: dihydrodipicolinate synthase family protein [Flammeovirgaceae bacterium]|nr:dihydrodipicolinate synthase family protein [Flammeovirgaceae bacterium]|tara:strand:+ start:485 stop:1399 length:915 start_codon:yes stop_codon:yes gene_type:complete
MKVLWKGVYPALTTKFKQNLSIDYEAFMANVDFQIDAGIDGIILGGTLGEASALVGNEKSALIKATKVHVDGKLPVIINIAEQTTEGAITAAKSAQQDGADGLMILPPMRYKATNDETVAYFKAIAHSTDLEIMIYNNPIDYKINVTLDMFESLTACQNIVAVKESSRDISNITRMINRFGDRFHLLCGVDTLAAESLLMGADGWVAGLVCAFPKETVAIYRLIKAGRTAEAIAIYRWFLPLLELDINPQLVQNIKLAEEKVNLGSEIVRPPRLPLSGDLRAQVLDVIESSIASRPSLPNYLSL